MQKWVPAPQIMHSSIAGNASKPYRSAMHSPYTSRSEPEQLHMSLGEQKPCKNNENASFGLQLACCAPGLTTPGRAFRKVTGSLGGRRKGNVLTSRSLWKCIESQQNATDPAADKPCGQQDGQRQRSFTEKTLRNNMRLFYLLREEFWKGAMLPSELRWSVFRCVASRESWPETRPKGCRPHFGKSRPISITWRTVKWTFLDVQPNRVNHPRMDRIGRFRRKIVNEI